MASDGGIPGELSWKVASMSGGQVSTLAFLIGVRESKEKVHGVEECWSLGNAIQFPQIAEIPERLWGRLCWVAMAMVMLCFLPPCCWREWVCSPPSQGPQLVQPGLISETLPDTTATRKHSINWWNWLLTVSVPCSISQTPLLPSKHLPVIVVSPRLVNRFWFAFKGLLSSLLDSLLAVGVCL